MFHLLPWRHDAQRISRTCCPTARRGFLNLLRPDLRARAWLPYVPPVI